MYTNTRRLIRRGAALTLLLRGFCLVTSHAWAAENIPVTGDSTTEHDDHGQPADIPQGTYSDTCREGISGGFPCRNVEMLSRVTLDEMGGVQGNDSWGWKDGPRKRYYALMGMDNGVSFVDITDPEDPAIVGFLPTEGAPSSWRDVKVYQNHAYVVADNNPDHGMQVFKLRKLRNGSPGRRYRPDVHYTEFGSAHNIAINEATGYAYVVGSDSCAGGLHMIDISTPDAPAFAGCYAGDGYTHDVQCVTWAGPDEVFAGRELCFGSNEDSLTISDVTDKQAPGLVGKLAYPDVGYSHQGWLTDDHRFFILGDEIDEQNTGANARTLVFDVSNPAIPRFVGAHSGPNNTIDHNLFLRGKFIFQANYTAGLRILLAEDFGSAKMREVAYFDTAPDFESRSFQGAWNVYPFFDNGVILVSDMQAGLFVLRADLPGSENAPINGKLSGVYAAADLHDQGMTITVGENDFGPFIFVAWFVYLDGEPFWLSGAAPFEYGDKDVGITLERLSGPDFLDEADGEAVRSEVGVLHLHAHSCNAVHLNYDFGVLGEGELHMTSIAGVQGRECPPSEHY